MIFTVSFAGWSRTGGRREGVAQVTARAGQFYPVSPITYRLPTVASMACIGAGVNSMGCILKGQGGQWNEARHRLDCGRTWDADTILTIIYACYTLGVNRQVRMQPDVPCAGTRVRHLGISIMDVVDLCTSATMDKNHGHHVDPVVSSRSLDS